MHFTKNHNHNHNHNHNLNKPTTFRISKNFNNQNERITAIKYTNADSLLKWE